MRAGSDDNLSLVLAVGTGGFASFVQRLAVWMLLRTYGGQDFGVRATLLASYSWLMQICQIFF